MLAAGIVVGTLGDRGYLQAARHVRALAEAAGKKTYTLLMGRPSPAKLANFPEVEVFVMVADAPGLVLDDSRDYFAPVITPWEALLAFDDDLEWTGEYKLGFQCLLVSCLLSLSVSTSTPQSEILCYLSLHSASTLAVLPNLIVRLHIVTEFCYSGLLHFSRLWAWQLHINLKGAAAEHTRRPGAVCMAARSIHFTFAILFNKMMYHGKSEAGAA